MRTIYVVTVADDTNTEIFGNKAYSTIAEAQRIVELWEAKMGNTVTWSGYNKTTGTLPDRPDYDYLINTLTLD